MRVKRLNLFPLSARDQALARALALYPADHAAAIAAATLGGFVVNGEPIEIDADASQYAKYQSLNRTLVSNGHSEKLLREWRACSDLEMIRRHLQEMVTKTEARTKRAQEHLDEEGAVAFRSMLEEELSALKHEQQRAQI
jgi:hypothetical protein